MIPKILVAVVWLFAIGSFFVEAPWSAAGRWLFALLVVVHFIECAVFLPRLRQAPGPLARHLFGTLVFGFLHVRELPATSGAEPVGP